MPLTAPPDWADRLRTLPVDELNLSYNPQRLALPAGRSMRDVENDLAGGAWLTRVNANRADVFRLGGTEFELRVKHRPSRYSGDWIAEVLNIDESRSVPRHGTILPRVVTFEKVWDEVPCDLAGIERELRDRERRLREEGRRAGPGQVEVRAHGALQRSVLREYGELETLVAVLEQRPERPEDTIVGVVLPERGRRRNGRPSIVIRSDASDIGLFRNKRVRLVRADDQQYNTTTMAVRGAVLEVAEPRDWVVEPGERLSVSIVPPFGMRQNAEALAKFRAADIEGSWDDLARLLCQPQDLVLPASPAPPAMFYCDDDPATPTLNDEQRSAVTGAVGSPHAFLIQGPPGTGKTEVICEIVRQLIGRGERVLLLAPTHVAVDEVLSRVGRKPGLRPLRITWSDDQVDEELHAFLPANVGIELANRLTRPTDHGQLARWQRESGAVDMRLAELARADEVRQRHGTALTALRAAAQAATEAAERLRARQAAANAESAELEQELAERRDALAAATVAAADAARAADVVRAEHGPGLIMLRDAADELARSVQAAVDAKNGAHQAADTLRAWLAGQSSRVDRAMEFRMAAEQAAAGAHQGMTWATRQLADARAALAHAQAQQTGFGRFAEQLGLGQVARWRRTAQQAEQVAAQWNAELAERHNHWQAAVAEHNRLLQDGARHHANLQATQQSQMMRLQNAEQRHDHALHQFDSALAAVGVIADFQLRSASPDQVVALGEALRDYIARAVADPAEHAADVQLAELRWHLHGTTDLGVIRAQVEALSQAGAERDRLDQEQGAAARRHDEQAAQLQEARLWAGAEIERFTAESDIAQAELADRRAELDTIIAERDRFAALLGIDDLDAEEARLRRRRYVLDRLPALDARWRELAAERTDDQFADDIRHSLIRATNLVCATTKGVVGKGSHIVRHTDYDTLIVDEASRVTESEFLIGAVKARRWVLVGDEYQLPPYVDQEDEHFLHALIALNRTDRGESETVADAVGHLADIWEEDEKERRYRQESVQEKALELDTSGQWQSVFRPRFAEAYDRFSRAKGGNGDNDRNLLQAMRRYLVQSLFERAVTSCRVELRQPLVWQRRMISPLARIVNKPVYGGNYQSPSDTELAKAGVTPLVLPSIFERPATLLDTSHYDDAGDSEYRHGFVNLREQDWIVRACKIFNDALRAPVTASVLAFYRAQARALERRLLAMKLPMLQWEVIDVIDRIQGQQSDLVMLSFTRASLGGFGTNYGQWLQDVRRLNVACSRARRALVLVGHGKTLRRLRTSQQAVDFYANLFDLLETDENFQLIRRFG